jgi:hypothetical protein
MRRLMSEIFFCIASRSRANSASFFSSAVSRSFCRTSRISASSFLRCFSACSFTVSICFVSFARSASRAWRSLTNFCCCSAICFSSWVRMSFSKSASFFRSSSRMAAWTCRNFA